MSFRKYQVVEKEFVYRGFPCYVIFQPLGFRCGYVAIHKNQSIKTDIEKIECHNGISYANEVCPFGEKDYFDFWFLGFNCNLNDDIDDIEAVEKYYGKELVDEFYDEVERADNDKNKVCSLEFCEEELRKIVDQLIDGTDEAKTLKDVEEEVNEIEWELQKYALTHREGMVRGWYGYYLYLCGGQDIRAEDTYTPYVLNTTPRNVFFDSEYIAEDAVKEVGADKVKKYLTFIGNNVAWLHIMSKSNLYESWFKRFEEHVKIA